MESAGDNLKRKKKQYYSQKRQRRFEITAGLKGFLCSCNFNERDCVKESYNLLNKYADKLYPPKEKEEVDEEQGIEEELSAEVDKLKNERGNEERRFQYIDTGAKNLLFIKTTLDEPIEVTKEIVDDIIAEGKQQTRFLIRLVPVETTCKAVVGEIREALKPLLKKNFDSGSKTFSIVYNHRFNNTLNKEEVIKLVADDVFAIRADHKVDLKGAETSIIIEIIKTFAYLSVVPNYLKNKKHNLHLICKPEENKE